MGNLSTMKITEIGACVTCLLRNNVVVKILYRSRVISLFLIVLLCTSTAISMAGQRSLPPSKSGLPVQPASPSQQVRLVAQTGASQGVGALAFSPNGRILASGNGSAVTLWDIASGNELRVLPGAGAAIAFTPDGTRIVGLTSKDKSGDKTNRDDRGVAVIWDVATGRQMDRIKCQVGWLNYSVISPDTRLVATTTLRNTIALCDLDAGGAVHELAAPPKAVLHGWAGAGAFSRQGNLFAATTNGDMVELWDVRTRKHLRTLAGEGLHARDLVFSPDGHLLAGSGAGGRTFQDSGGEIVLWNITEKTPPRILERVNPEVRSLDFAPDGKTIVGACYDNTVQLWNVETGSQIASFPGNSYGALPIRFSPDGRFLAARENRKNGEKSASAEIRMWDVSTGKEYRRFREACLEVQAVAFSPDGRTLALGDAIGAVHLWDMTRGQPVRILAGHTEQIMHLAFSPDGRWLVVSSWDSTVSLWEVATGALAHLFPRESSPGRNHFSGPVSAKEDHDPAWTVDFSPDSKLVAAAGGDTTRVWDVGTWKRRFTLTGHGINVRSVLFTRDGQEILTSAGYYHGGSGYGAVCVWSAADGSFIRYLPSQYSGFWWLATPTNPNAEWLAAVSGDDIVLWDTLTWKEVRALTRPIHTALMPQIASSPDGKLLAAGYYDGALCLWDITTGRLLDSVTLHSGGINSVAFSPDGKHLMTVGTDTTRCWTIQANRLQSLCTLYMFQNNTWAVSDGKSHFDASNDGNIDGLYGVVNNHPIPLSQLKTRYYEPGLLAKYLGLQK